MWIVGKQDATVGRDNHGAVGEPDGDGGDGEGLGEELVGGRPRERDGLVAAGGHVDRGDGRDGRERRG